ncbi:hypothetical protein [Polaromonas jejuensis]|uniref:Uncharacterized protein n=1 Tax=Polaromonas jejuensis TaxID=457502 RepID=A0ABW0QEB1_9BURK|nr:hypothetical protein [Polaromonas jejuensis]
MSHSTLVNTQLNTPLRTLALTVEEAGRGEFRWRILESHGNPQVFEPVSCSDTSFSAYDTALATGYGELQRLIGPDLQYGPRQDADSDAALIRLAAAQAPKAPAASPSADHRPVNGGGIKPGMSA